MSIYEIRTYSLKVGQMSEAVRLYTEEGWPALEAGGHATKLWATSLLTPVLCTS